MIDETKVLRTIREHMLSLPEDQAYPLETGKNTQSWIIHKPKRIGVAIEWPVDGSFVDEFSTAAVGNMVLNLGQADGSVKQTKVLMLYVDDIRKHGEDFRDQFAMLCLNFVMPGENGENRNTLLNDPEKWCNRWKEMMGNAMVNRPVQGIVGELMVYRWLCRQGIQAAWTASDFKRVDFETERQAFEVKSTMNRNENKVHINGQFQLQVPEGKTMDLIFCRMERSAAGESIDDLVSNLAAMGESKKDLEAVLSALHYPEGQFQRQEKYRCLEMLKYPVDDKFPRITGEMFKNGKIPNGILNLSYEVDLSNLAYEKIATR